MITKKIFVSLIVMFSFCFSVVSNAMDVNPSKSNNWDNILKSYRYDEKVNELVFVKYKGKTYADIVMYVKQNKDWKEILSCEGFVGKEGIGFGSRYSSATPMGIYNIIFAFGIKDDLQTELSHFKVGDSHYCCASREHNNRFVDSNAGAILCLDKNTGEIQWKEDSSLVNHNCSKDVNDGGEHLIEYSPQYDYAFMFDYNSEGAHGRGAAFFFHVKGKNEFTGGCIAVSEENMKFILKNLRFGSKVCIGYAEGFHESTLIKSN